MLALISIIVIAASIAADQHYLYIINESQEIDQQIEDHNLTIRKVTKEIVKELDCQNEYLPCVHKHYVTCQKDQCIVSNETEINTEGWKYLPNEWLDNNASYHALNILERTSLAYMLMKTFIVKKNEHTNKQKQLSQIKENFFSKNELLSHIKNHDKCDKDSYIFVYKTHPESILTDIEIRCVRYLIENSLEQETDEYRSLDFLEAEIKKTE